MNEANSQNDLLDGLLGDFLDESDQLLTQLNDRLLQLDAWVHTLDDDHQEPCDPNLLNEMFRAAHSLKGLSAMLGLTDINNLTHKIENVFDAARKNELTVNGDVTELVFMGLDQLAALIERLKEPGNEPVDCSAVLDAIRRLLQKAGVERKQSTQRDAEQAMLADPMQESKPPASAAPSAAAAPAPASDADPLADVADEDEIPERYLSIFIDESEATLDGLTAALLASERGGAGDALKSLMGAAHKIKGSAASIGLNRIAKLAHLMEDLLEELLDKHASLSAEMTDVLLKCTDALQRHVTELKQGTARSDHFGRLARELLAARSRGSTGKTGGRTTYVGEVRFQPAFPAAGLKAQVICEKLAKLGELSACEPPREELDEIEQLDCFRFRLATDQPLDAVQDRLRIAGVLAASVEPLGGVPGKDEKPELTSAEAALERPSAAAGAAPAAPKPAARQPVPEGEPRGSDAGQRPTETVRVDIDRLDHLMDLAGQLVINKAQFAQIGENLRGVLGCKQSAQALKNVSTELDRMGAQIALRLDAERSPSALEAVRSHVRRIQNELEPLRREVQTFSRSHDFVEDLFEAIHQLGRVSDGIQQSVMDTRMVPIGPLFARFKRVVRDIARSSGKQARLEIRGENTELDKRMIDELGDPLVHLRAQFSGPRHRVARRAGSGGKAARGDRDARRVPSREQHRHRSPRRWQGVGRRSHPAKVPGKGPGDQGRRGENDDATDLPEDLGTGLEHGGKGDRSLRPRNGNGHRQVENRGTQRNGRHRQRPRTRHDDHDQAAVDAGDPPLADGGDPRGRVRHSHGNRGRNRQRRPQPVEFGARTANGERAGTGGLPAAARRPAGLPRRRRRRGAPILGSHPRDRRRGGRRSRPRRRPRHRRRGRGHQVDRRKL